MLWHVAFMQELGIFYCILMLVHAYSFFSHISFASFCGCATYMPGYRVCQLRSDLTH